MSKLPGAIMPFSFRRAVAVVLTAAASGGGAEPSARAPGPIVLSRCTLEFEKTTLLGASQTGVVSEMLVRPGDRVKGGQVLGRLFDSELRAELELRRAEAENDTDIRLGEAKLALALSKLKASEALSKRNLISAEELTTHKLDAQSATLEIEAARHKRHFAGLASRQVEAMISSREFLSPHDGIVVMVFKRKGESIAPNESVLRLVGSETVRVTGYLDIGDAWRIKAGQQVRVKPEISGAELPIEEEVFIGQVDYVDPEINPETQTCKVVAIVENKGALLRAGLEARMEIIPEGTTADLGDARRTPSDSNVKR
jgi:cobalt-zinc-cadmium efflux system membrane fusion protein